MKKTPSYDGRTRGVRPTSMRRGETPIGRKERILNRLDKEGLLELANSVSSTRFSRDTGRVILVSTVKNALSIQEIKRQLRMIDSRSPRLLHRRWLSALLFATMIAPAIIVPISFVLISLVPSESTPAWEQWRVLMPGCTVSCVQKTPDGGCILAGQNNGFWAAKVDRGGVLQWSGTYTQGYTDTAYSVQQTSDGGYIIAGCSSYLLGMPGFDRPFLVKLDSQGNLQWSRFYGGFRYASRARDVRQTADEGYILAGETEINIGNETAQIFITVALLMRVNPQGAMLWNVSCRTRSCAYSVEVTSDGGCISSGVYEAIGEPSAAWLARTDSSGNMLWNRTYRSAGTVAYCIEASSDGRYLVAGVTYSYQYTAFLMKIDSEGLTYWIASYGGTYPPDYSACAYSVQQTKDRGCFVGGYRQGSAWILRTDSEGKELWSRTVSDYGAYSISGAQETSDGGYIAAATTDAGALIIKLISLESTAYAIIPLLNIVSAGIAYCIVLAVLAKGRRKTSRPILSSPSGAST